MLNSGFELEGRRFTIQALEFLFELEGPELACAGLGSQNQA